MLRELRDVSQVEKRRRRWFTDDYFDLIVWYERSTVYGFQLCYDTQGSERALTWVRGRGFAHNRVEDDGDPKANRTPILVQDGLFDSGAIAERFRAASAEIDPEVARLVLEVLQRFPDAQAQGRQG